MPLASNGTREPEDRKMGRGSDAVNVLLFVGALTLVLALLSIPDPKVKQLFLRILPS